MKSQVNTLIEDKHEIMIHAAHELNTPITSLMMITYLLKNDPGNFSDKNKYLESIETLEKACDRLNRTVQNVLLYHTFKHNRFILSHDKFTEAEHYIKNIIKTLSTGINRLNDVKSLFPDNSDLPISIGREHFVLVVNEVIRNAFNFSKAGTKIFIEYYFENGYAVFTIIDCGVGMSEDEILSLNAYTQLHRVHYEQQGLGLGLVLVKCIIEAYSGKFYIQSTKGSGTKVKLSIPLVVS